MMRPKHWYLALCLLGTILPWVAFIPFLQAHPDCAMPGIKEINFFNSPLFSSGGIRRPRLERKWAETRRKFAAFTVLQSRLIWFMCPHPPRHPWRHGGGLPMASRWRDLGRDTLRNTERKSHEPRYLRAQGRAARTGW